MKIKQLCVLFSNLGRLLGNYLNRNKNALFHKINMSNIFNKYLFVMFDFIFLFFFKKFIPVKNK